MHYLEKNVSEERLKNILPYFIEKYFKDFITYLKYNYKVSDVSVFVFQNFKIDVYHEKVEEIYDPDYIFKILIDSFKY